MGIRPKRSQCLYGTVISSNIGGLTYGDLHTSMGLSICSGLFRPSRLFRIAVGERFDRQEQCLWLQWESARLSCHVPPCRDHDPLGLDSSGDEGRSTLARCHHPASASEAYVVGGVLPPSCCEILCERPTCGCFTGALFFVTAHVRTFCRIGNGNFWSGTKSWKAECLEASADRFAVPARIKPIILPTVGTPAVSVLVCKY